jgi:hypothetical protein
MKICNINVVAYLWEELLFSAVYRESKCVNIDRSLAIMEMMGMNEKLECLLV